MPIHERAHRRSPKFDPPPLTALGWGHLLNRCPYVSLERFVEHARRPPRQSQGYPESTQAKNILPSCSPATTHVCYALCCLSWDSGLSSYGWVYFMCSCREVRSVSNAYSVWQGHLRGCSTVYPLAGFQHKLSVISLFREGGGG